LRRSDVESPMGFVSSIPKYDIDNLFFIVNYN
jgi:hypothetical protein